MKRRISKTLESHRKLVATIFILIFAVIGTYLIFATKAATPAASFEPESSSLSSPAVIGTDSNASNGNYVQFKTAATGGGGTAKPNAANTGWQPTGVTLTATGGMTITTDGTVIDSKDISGQVTVQANNVTVKRSRIRTTSYTPIYVKPGYSNVVISDNEVDGMMGPSDGGTKCISFYGSGSVLRNNVHHCEDGFSAGSNGPAVFSQNYAHDLKVIYSAPHSDGIEYYAGSNVTITYNNFDNTGGTTSAINLTNDFGPISNSTISNNWLTGGSFNYYIDGSHGGGTIGGITVTNNRFTRNSAAYGTHLVRGDLGAINWSGNVYDDNGEAIAL